MANDFVHGTLLGILLGTGLGIIKHYMVYLWQPTEVNMVLKTSHFAELAKSG
jgi:hypothetical protein